MTARGRLAGVLLTVGAALGTLCLLSVLAAVAFGVRPLVVRSGSMAPTIPTGSLALARSVPAAEVAVGDVVSVVGTSGGRVTHRVVDVATSSTDGRRALSLQGDANSSPDAAPYVVDRVDRVLVDAPLLGYVVAWTAGPAGRFAAGALVGAIALLGWPRRAGRPPMPQHLARPVVRRGRRGLVRGAIATVAAGALVGGTDVATARPAMAAFADSATLSTGSFAGYTVPAPVVTNCTVSGNSLSGFTARISWTAVSSPHVLTYAAHIVNTGTALTVQASGTTRYVDVQSGLLGSLLGHPVTIEMVGRSPGPTTWTSVPAQKQVQVAALGLSMSCLP